MTTVDKSKNPLARARDAVWNPSTASLRLLALAAVVVNAGIILTGGVVRLTSSGLGCPTWPKCTGESLVPSAHPSHSLFNMLIEFGNRMLTFLVLAVAVSVFVAARRLRPQRRELVVLALLQPLGVLLQAGIGGITVLTKLNPSTVSIHYLCSSALIFAAFLLYVRVGEGDGPVRVLVAPPVRGATRLLTATVVAVLIVGTLVTGTGPHAGDSAADRLTFMHLHDITRIHSFLAWATVVLAVVLLVLMARTGAPARTRRAVHLFLGAVLLQGVIGYAQFFLLESFDGNTDLSTTAVDVQTALVGVHLFGSAILWIAALHVLFSQRVRAEVPAAPVAG
ncbi:cytochrome c oxidase assembly protein subunit 15 [Actinocorallia herbida]|uniref:Cytochrome c oxidase assembly protein subunit 15 n=1 Tax=Actinocorallia herbida TaxID=58109 RepID=A0A3N1CS67_9ACTN|nr:cytochrome c oxidase assembly protein subunit 15 [Actinocorallia herbida]